jgi:hypothetical protein
MIGCLDFDFETSYRWRLGGIFFTPLRMDVRLVFLGVGRVEVGLAFG